MDVQFDSEAFEGRSVQALFQAQTSLKHGENGLKRLSVGRREDILHLVPAQVARIAWDRVAATTHLARR